MSVPLSVRENYLHTSSSEHNFDPGSRAAGGTSGKRVMSRAHSSRVYGEPVNVQARDDGRPARFVWRGRLYTVRAILEHWVISREWWQDPGGPGPEPGQPELEFWRIEASPGKGLAAAFYELRREAASGAWMLRPHLAAWRHAGTMAAGSG